MISFRLSLLCIIHTSTTPEGVDFLGPPTGLRSASQINLPPSDETLAVTPEQLKFALTPNYYKHFRILPRTWYFSSKDVFAIKCPFRASGSGEDDFSQFWILSSDVLTGQ